MGEIKKLPDQVINRIAAGEVIQHPVSAIKELIENSIDSKASKITIIVEKGGLELISIKDDGCGIFRADLSILCERYTTSKLEQVEDLLSIDTFGFRGEALASLSQVSSLTVITKRKDSEIGYKTTYELGQVSQQPAPCAATNGTNILVQNLFYNLATRRKSLKSSLEYRKVLDVVKCYAIHYGKTEYKDSIDFECKSSVSSIPDVKSQNSSQIQLIAKFFGKEISNELLKVRNPSLLTSVSRNSLNQEKNVTDDLQWSLYGYVSNSNYSPRKAKMIFFVNNRLVTFKRLQKSLENLYSDLVRKGHSCFAYLSLYLPAKDIDVNIHPSKSEVCILYEEEIVRTIVDEISELLKQNNESRVFKAPVLSRSNTLPVFSIKKTNRISSKTLVPSIRKSSSLRFNEAKPKDRYRPEKLIRTDFKANSLDNFWKRNKEISLIETEESTKSNEVPKLTSIKELQQEVEARFSTDLKILVNESVFVGVVDNNYCMIQSKTGLYVADIVELSKECYYQRVLTLFGTIRLRALSTKLDVAKLLISFLSSSIGKSICENMTDDVLQKKVKTFCVLLAEKKDMLFDYFKIKFELSGVHSGEKIFLTGLPELIENHQLVIAGLPVFLFRLCTQIDWNVEKTCFRGIAFELAEFYSILPHFPKNYNSVNENLIISEEDQNKGEEYEKYVKQVLLPCFKVNLKPPKEFSLAENFVVTLVADLKDLYKVFERC